MIMTMMLNLLTVILTKVVVNKEGKEDDSSRAVATVASKK
jgi:hypothetical protein